MAQVIVLSAIDPALIKQLLANERKPRGPRAKRDTRDYDKWFDMDHILDKECEVPEHEEHVALFEFVTLEDYEKALSRKRVVIDHNGILMCRYCFISGAGKLND